jgi:predicted nucleic acid-binding protein
MDRILIDTDVLLDFFYDRQPFSIDAAKVLSICELKLIHGYVTPVICSNLYYLLRQNANHEKVIGKISHDFR